MQLAAFVIPGVTESQMHDAQFHDDCRNTQYNFTPQSKTETLSQTPTLTSLELIMHVTLKPILNCNGSIKPCPNIHPNLDQSPDPNPN